MVVEYATVALDHLEPVVGVFIADDDIQSILRLSEPPSHNRWDPDNNRLELHDRPVVSTVLRRIERQTREFQRFLLPPPPPSTGRLVALENLLAK
jgi:hypothetical protein